MRVLVAPDKFKGSLTAAEVAERIAAGLRAADRGLEVATLPIADGGDGTLDAAVAAGFERVTVLAAGPTGEQLQTCYARRGDTAVVELADTCGLLRLPSGRPDPSGASSLGLGQVVRAALAAGCRNVVIGIGGSASTDGGAGLLAGLGARILDSQGLPLPLGGAALADAATLDLTGLDPALRRARLTIACDVDNPLYGPNGAAVIYAPQKGATNTDVERLDLALRHWAALIEEIIGSDRAHEPGAGAAGGVGFAATAVLGASLRPGAELVFNLIGFSASLAGCGLVVTGEGRLDEQTLAGKAPARAAAAARAAGIPAVAVAGQNTLTDRQLEAAGITAVYPLTDLEADPDRCIQQAGPLLERIGRRIAEAYRSTDRGHQIGHEASPNPDRNLRHHRNLGHQ